MAVLFKHLKYPRITVHIILEFLTRYPFFPVQFIKSLDIK